MSEDFKVRIEVSNAEAQYLGSIMTAIENISGYKQKVGCLCTEIRGVVVQFPYTMKADEELSYLADRLKAVIWKANREGCDISIERHIQTMTLFDETEIEASEYEEPVNRNAQAISLINAALSSIDTGGEQSRAFETEITRLKKVIEILNEEKLDDN